MPDRPHLTGAPQRVLAGRYRLVQRLAAGGMGEVWSARDDVLHRTVAVKLLKPELAADPRLVARFRREAVAAARLSHPNIVRVFDTVSDAGAEAVVMELVLGRTLRQVLDDEPRLTPRFVLTIGAALADALDAAHRAGVVHRDVKPGNVLLTNDGRILLADFGLAKVLDGDDGLSGPRVMIGTAKYLAPEQVSGTTLDGRADLYSLGVVLFECLTGRVPFQGDTDADTAKARVERDAPPVRSIRPGTPRGVADLVDRLLARKPDRRPSSASTVREEMVRLQRTLVEEPESPVPIVPVAAGPNDADLTPAVPFRAGPTHRHRSWMASVLVILLVAGGLVAAAVAVARTETGDRLLQQVKDNVAGKPEATTTVAAATSATPRLPATPAEIVSTAEFDPPPAGDGRENPQRLGALTDGNPDTTWASVCYQDANFAPKPGIGLVLSLSVPAAGHDLLVTSPATGWSADVFVVDRPEPPSTLAGWSKPVATVGPTTGPTVRVNLGDAPGRQLLLLFRKATTTARCGARFQAVIGEVALST